MGTSKHAPECEGVQLGMIITPMLDMYFQLMAFFIMVYNPSPLETHVQGKLLPFAKTLTAGPAVPDKKDDTPPVDKEPDVKESLRVIIKAARKDQPAEKVVGKEDPNRPLNDGEPMEIRLKRPEETKEDSFAVISNKRELDNALADLGKALKKIREGPTGNDLTVSLDPDPHLKYEYFIQVYDVCKAAKFKEIGFNAPLK
jgi:biopolymer transport protein ExbD